MYPPYARALLRARWSYPVAFSLRRWSPVVRAAGSAQRITETSFSGAWEWDFYPEAVSRSVASLQIP